MDLFRESLYKQNNELLRKITQDFFPKMKEEQIEFIYKYNKKNFTYMPPSTRELININEKKVKRVFK